MARQAEGSVLTISSESDPNKWPEPARPKHHWKWYKPSTGELFRYHADINIWEPISAKKKLTDTN